MEKQMPLDRPLAGRSPSADRQRTASRVAIFAVVIALWALISWQFLTSRSDGHPLAAELGLRTYPGESIRWRPCGDGPLITDQDEDQDQDQDRDLECSTIQVPMDHFAPQPHRTDGTARTFTIPLVRMRGRGHSPTNLLVSLGGPGTGGVAFLRGSPRARAALRRLVGDTLHIIGFDPRGFGASTPPASCYASAASRARLRRPVRSSDLIRDSPYLYAWAANYGRACQDNGGEHLACVNTPQTAADLNVILDALGQRRLVYWGVGYGALLGQVHASTYPDRAGRVVLDALPDQEAWFGAMLDARRYGDADAVVDGFFEACARAGAGRCALAEPGVTGAALRENVTRVVDRLYRNPASAYVNGSAYGVVDDFTARIRGLLRGMHAPADWPALARRLADLRAGDATGMFLAYGGDDDDDEEAAGGLVVRLNDGRSGRAGGWPQARMRLLEMLLLHLDRRRWAAGEARMLHAKQQWPVARRHAYVPRRQQRTGATRSVLVLAAARDPAWPQEEAGEGRPRRVTREGYGNGAGAVPSLCVAGRVRAYLVNGTLPEEDVVCGRDGEYFPGAEEGGAGYTPEEREVLAAQRDLSIEIQANLYI